VTASTENSGEQMTSWYNFSFYWLVFVVLDVAPTSYDADKITGSIQYFLQRMFNIGFSTK